MAPSVDAAHQIAELKSKLDELKTKLGHGEDSRMMLLSMLRHQVSVVESPLDMVWRMMMEPHQTASLRAAMAMGLIDTLSSSANAMTASELAISTKCDKQLIIRILRPLAAMSIVDEVAYETYGANPRTRILATPVGGGYKFMFDEAATCAIHMPSFLSRTGFKNPEGPIGNFQSAMNTDLQMFPWLMAHPDHMSNFNDLMMGQRMNRIEWFEFADVDSILSKGTNADGEIGTLLVDIGGGRGHDLEAFQSKFPEQKGTLVLQDLPQVIDDIKELRSDIVRMKYDFFTPQPIQGARAYYFRSILHDYSDRVCIEILRVTVAAMKPGYSKLLIFEWILPDTGTPLYPALLDINMLALLSGMERTETQWRELLEKVGLEVVKFWTIGKETEGLIEAVLKV